MTGIDSPHFWRGIRTPGSSSCVCLRSRTGSTKWVIPPPKGAAVEHRSTSNPSLCRIRRPDPVRTEPVDPAGLAARAWKECHHVDQRQLGDIVTEDPGIPIVGFSLSLSLYYSGQAHCRVPFLLLSSPLDVEIVLWTSKVERERESVWKAHPSLLVSVLCLEGCSIFSSQTDSKTPSSNLISKKTFLSILA